MTGRVLALLPLVALSAFSAVQDGKARRQAWERVQSRLDAADRDDAARIDAAAKRVEDFFAEAKTRSRSFADAMLSLKAKWEFLKSRFGDGKSYEEFMERTFGERVLSSEQLVEAISGAARAHVRGLQEGEERLWDDVARDVKDLDREKLRSPRGERLGLHLAVVLALAVDRREIDRAADAVAKQVALDLGVELGATAVLTGAAIATAKPTGGLSFAVAAVVDLLVTLFLDWLLDSTGKIEKAVNGALDKVRDGLVASLRRELAKIHEARGAQRREALRKLVCG